MKYRAVFFDLDHTLWDYDTNSRETLIEIFEQHGLAQRGVPDATTFANVFQETNDRLWYQFDRGLITSETLRNDRFVAILRAFGVDDAELASQLSDDYLHACPRRCNLMPHAIDTLQYLSGRYALTVVTNGFEDVQKIKLTSGNLLNYFDHIVTSQKAGYRKPAKEIFEYALRSNAVRPEETLMVGDNLLTDIGGAVNASIDTAFFNPQRTPHDTPVNYEISSLIELCSIL
ncbi:MAG: YjjG family noncanonical pyrimidine nucleotidase [Cyclobacteriaceae bacterium]|nr:YjjG family noncanonical pyrimidine nucleotidase [Cyclobacteriaceae bacterium]